MKKNKITWMPPLRQDEHGWLVIGEDKWRITKWHHFNDFGQTLETVTAEKDGVSVQAYSLDEGTRFVFDLDDWKYTPRAVNA